MHTYLLRQLSLIDPNTGAQNSDTNEPNNKVVPKLAPLFSDPPNSDTCNTTPVHDL
jgi:hypothetical protein